MPLSCDELEHLNAGKFLSLRWFGNIPGLLLNIEMSILGCIERVNQRLVTIRCFFKFTYVHGKDGDIWKHFVESFYYFFGKVCLLFGRSAFHNVCKDMDEILFVFSQLEVLERTEPNFYIVFCKET